MEFSYKYDINIHIRIMLQLCSIHVLKNAEHKLVSECMQLGMVKPWCDRTYSPSAMLTSPLLQNVYDETLIER